MPPAGLCFVQADALNHNRGTKQAGGLVPQQARRAFARTAGANAEYAVAGGPFILLTSTSAAVDTASFIATNADITVSSPGNFTPRFFQNRT